MYMYYLLGFKLFGDQEGEFMKMVTKQTSNIKELRRQANESDHFGKSKIFHNMDNQILSQVRMQRHRTTHIE